MVGITGSDSGRLASRRFLPALSGQSFVGVLLVGALIFSLILTPASVYATPAYNGGIGLSPGQITVSPGQTFSISVDVYDTEVSYNGATVSITLGDGLSFVGADYAGSAFDATGTADVAQGKYNSCVVLSRSSTTILSGTSHLANLLFRVSSAPDYDTAHNGTVLEQDWTGCGPSSDIYLNGEQANQGAEEGGEVFVNLTTQTPATIPTAAKPPSATTPTTHTPTSSAPTTATTSVKAGSSTTTGQVKGARTEIPVSSASSLTVNANQTTPKAKAFASHTAANKSSTGYDALLVVAVLVLTAASAYLYTRSRKSI